MDADTGKVTRMLHKFAPEPHTPTDSTGADGAASPATRPYSRPVPKLGGIATRPSGVGAQSQGGNPALPDASGLLALRDAFALVIAYQSNTRRNDPVRDWLNAEFWRIHFSLPEVESQ